MTSIYAVHYNRPDFIELQNLCFKQFFKNNYEFIVVNNAREASLRNEINNEASKLGLRVIETFSDTPFNLCGQHHADALNQVWKKEAINKKLVLIVDGDVFLLDGISFTDFFNEYDDALFGVPQHRTSPTTGISYNYLSPTVVGIDTRCLTFKQKLDWSGCEVEPGVHLDTGGGLWPWCMYAPNIVSTLSNTWHIKSENNNLHTLPDKLLESYKEGYDVELYGDIWLHYCRSSAWDWSGENYHKEKTEWIKRFIYGRLDNTIALKYTAFDFGVNDWLGWE